MPRARACEDRRCRADNHLSPAVPQSRRLERPGEYDFVTYFECEDEHLSMFDQVCASLRDMARNPEWNYVTEGPLWKGRRTLKW
jgi:hypothetical protein